MKILSIFFLNLIFAIFLWRYWANNDQSDLQVNITNDHFLFATERDDIDHSFFLHNLNDIIEEVRKADILVMGNSRMLNALDYELVKTHNETENFKIYNFSFAHAESNTFPFHIIKKYGLTPKTIVVHVGPYTFSLPVSGPAKKALSSPPWYAYRKKLEFYGNTHTQHFIHKFLPQFRNSKGLKIKSYRSYSNGCISYQVSKHKPIYFKVRNDSNVFLSDVYLEQSRIFKAYCKKNNIELLLTQVPAPNLNPHLLDSLAKEMEVATIKSYPKEMATFDGSHLTKLAATHFTHTFLEELMLSMNSLK